MTGDAMSAVGTCVRAGDGAVADGAVVAFGFGCGEAGAGLPVVVLPLAGCPVAGRVPGALPASRVTAGVTGAAVSAGELPCDAVEEVVELAGVVDFVAFSGLAVAGRAAAFVGGAAAGAEGGAEALGAGWLAGAEGVALAVGAA